MVIILRSFYFIVHTCTSCEEDILPGQHCGEDSSLLLVQLPGYREGQNRLLAGVGFHLKHNKTKGFIYFFETQIEH